MNIPKIFIVDDEPQNFDVIETMLIDHGYHLFYASSGEDALQMIESVQPDMVLLDVMMPGMDGIELCCRLKADSAWQHVPIIIFTALNQKEDLARCPASGADDFISKPVNSTELSARTQSMLWIKQQYDQLQTFNAMQQNTIHLLNETLATLRGNLTWVLPHELRTPLNGIVGALDLLVSDEESQRDPEDQEMLDLAYESALRLEKLSERFLHIAKNHLTWLIQELVDNACKFSQPGTPITIRGQINDDQQFDLSIQDRGHGMTAEQIAKIDAFVQFERKQYEQQGTGLGLAIVSKVIELYNGTLDISSHYKYATIVQLTLPCTT